jgi:predicted RNase H-like nuclease (RuvC/YqgF family)
MKRIIIGIEINKDQEAVLKYTALIVNKESVSDYCRRKIFEPVTETKIVAEDTSNYVAEINTLKADLEKLQSDKADCDTKNKEQATEIATLKSDLETLQTNSKNTAIQKLAKQAQEIKEQAKQIKALTEEYEAVSDEFIKLQDKTFVSPSDLYLQLTPEEHTLVGLIMATYDEEVKKLICKKTKEYFTGDILYMIEKAQKYLPEEYQNPESAEYNLLTKLRDRLTLENQSEN